MRRAIRSRKIILTFLTLLLAISVVSAFELDITYPTVNANVSGTILLTATTTPSTANVTNLTFWYYNTTYYYNISGVTENLTLNNETLYQTECNFSFNTAGNLSDGTYTFGVFANNETDWNGTDYTINVSNVVVDNTAPTWSPTPTDQAVDANVSFSYDVDASDNVAVDSYSINDTTNFAIVASTGVITNATVLGVGVYSLNISVNDTSNNTIGQVILVTVAVYVAPAPTPAPSWTSPSVVVTVGLGETVYVTTIKAGDTGIFTFDEAKSPIIQEVEIVLKQEAYYTTVTVGTQEGTGRDDPLNELYKYLTIEYSKPNTYVEEVTIRFRVENSWLKENDIDPETVTLLRERENSKAWDELQTTKLEEDSEYTYYSAVTEGFSYFVITGEKAKIPITTAPPVTTAPPITTAPPVTTAPPRTTLPPVTTRPPKTTAPPLTTAPPKPKKGICGPTTILLLILISALGINAVEERKIRL